MKIFKRFLDYLASIALLAAIFWSLWIALGLTSCGRREPDGPEREPDVTQKEPSEAENLSTNSTDGHGEASLIEERILVEESGVRITAKTLHVSDEGLILGLQIENNASEQMGVALHNAVLNGFMAEGDLSGGPDTPSWALVGAGETEKALLKLQTDALYECGMGEPKTLSVSFHIYTADRFRTSVFTELCPVLETEGFTPTADETGTVVYDNQGLFVTCKGRTEDGRGLVLYLRSESEDILNVECRDATVNGVMAMSPLYVHLLPGTRAAATAAFYPYDDGEEFGELREADIQLEISNGEGQMLDMGSFTLTF